MNESKCVTYVERTLKCDGCVTSEHKKTKKQTTQTTKLAAVRQQEIQVFEGTPHPLGVTHHGNSGIVNFAVLTGGTAVI